MLPFSRPIYPVLFLVVFLAGAIAFPMVPRTGQLRQPRMQVVRFGFVRYHHSPVTNQWTILHTQEGRYAPFELQPWSVEHVETERWYLNIHGLGFTTEKQGDQWARISHSFEPTDGITLLEVNVEAANYNTVARQLLLMVDTINENQPPVLFIKDLTIQYGHHFQSTGMFNVYWPYMERMIVRRGTGSLSVLPYQDPEVRIYEELLQNQTTPHGSKYLK
ncbi:MAG: hypothetical protein NXY57DRAFT_1044213 [Lentinula lateritia]|uniref:Uncharacterized protein n=1 Tax=Lentinula lateritia TaxID=40482 RepID=A0ABQ8V8S5_9AGAR|nr:MAG: hypothetical protein NXY57DRAFT_1044213 [Lentinula lateritia]KAJ4473947.1 hypothetical protein C8R41DRAFT_870202 [Lentinula lateritia]